MPVYKITFPAVVTVWAENEDAAQEKAVSRANFDYCTSWEEGDIIFTAITGEDKE